MKGLLAYLVLLRNEQRTWKKMIEYLFVLGEATLKAVFRFLAIIGT
jgi:hypothetical protein